MLDVLNFERMNFYLMVKVDKMQIYLYNYFHIFYQGKRNKKGPFSISSVPQKLLYLLPTETNVKIQFLTAGHGALYNRTLWVGLLVRLTLIGRTINVAT